MFLNRVTLAKAQTLMVVKTKSVQPICTAFITCPHESDLTTPSQPHTPLKYMPLTSIPKSKWVKWK